jgi:hypothetical protein
MLPTKYAHRDRDHTQLGQAARRRTRWYPPKVIPSTGVIANFRLSFCPDHNYPEAQGEPVLGGEIQKSRLGERIRTGIMRTRLGG